MELIYIKNGTDHINNWLMVRNIQKEKKL